MTTPCQGAWYDLPCIEHARCKAALMVPGVELTWCGQPITEILEWYSGMQGWVRDILEEPCQCGDGTWRGMVCGKRYANST